jgi:flagellar hook-basal body complex protein FliE
MATTGTIPGFDAQALIGLFAEANARQGEALRKATADATLRALQGRELTLDAVKKAVKTVASAASMGAAQNPASPVDVEAMLGKALAGIDSALLQAVEANRTALGRFVEQGVSMGAKPMQAALAGVEKMEDTFFDAVAKAGKSAGPMQAAWDQALQQMRLKGSDTGARAEETMADLMERAKTSMRETRASGAKAAEAMLQGYATLVSGVLIGMSEGMRAATSGTRAPGAADADAAPAAKRKR